MATAQQRAEVTVADPRWAAVVARDPAADGRFGSAGPRPGVNWPPSRPPRRRRP